MNSARGRIAVIALLVHEEESPAGLSSPGDEVMVLHERGDLLDVDRLGPEEKEFLGVNKVPVQQSAIIRVKDMVVQGNIGVLGKVAALVLQLALLDGHNFLLHLLRSSFGCCLSGRGFGDVLRGICEM